LFRAWCQLGRIGIGINFVQWLRCQLGPLGPEEFIITAERSYGGGFGRDAPTEPGGSIGGGDRAAIAPMHPRTDLGGFFRNNI